MVDDAIRKRPRPDINQRYESPIKVGEGTYGFVFMAKDKKPPQKKVAIKKFKAHKEGEGISVTAYREIMLLLELDHENIIKIQDISINAKEHTLSLVLEYAEYDLSEIIRYHNKVLKMPPSTYTIKSMMWQVLNGIHYLHSNWVCHRDMKPSNLLIMNDDQQGVVKIADFGLARIFQSPLQSLSENGPVVTIWYRAPELLLGSKHYTKAVDIWAMGCIFAELLTTNPLFPGKEKDQKNPNLFQDIQLDKIFYVLGPPKVEDWPNLVNLPDWQPSQKWSKTLLEANINKYPQTSQLASAIAQHLQEFDTKGNAFDLLCHMIEYNPEKRITADAALDHPYFHEDPLPGRNSLVAPNQQYPPPYQDRTKLRKELDNIKV